MTSSRRVIDVRWTRAVGLKLHMPKPPKRKAVPNNTCFPLHGRLHYRSEPEPEPLQVAVLLAATRPLMRTWLPTWMYKACHRLRRRRRVQTPAPKLGTMSFDVGEDAPVVGNLGLVGCRVNVVWHADPDGRWTRGLYPCVVDAFAADRSAYVISWVKDRSEHHLKSSQDMADLARQRHRRLEPCVCEHAETKRDGRSARSVGWCARVVGVTQRPICACACPGERVQSVASRALTAISAAQDTRHVLSEGTSYRSAAVQTFIRRAFHFPGADGGSHGR